MSQAVVAANSIFLPDMNVFANQPVVVENGNGLIKTRLVDEKMPEFIYHSQYHDSVAMITEPIGAV
jgi:hypothetical protein